MPGAALAGLALPRAALAWTWWGWIGVELFFVISGYVIARSARGGSAGLFLRRRALRLVPAAVLCATASAAVLLVGGVERPGRLAGEWLVSAFLLPVGAPVDGSYWTLPIEVAFYLCVAAAIGLVGSARRIEAMGIALGLASIAVLAGLFPPLLSDGPLYIPMKLAMYGAEFALGIAMAAGHQAARPSFLRTMWTVAMAGVTLVTVAVHSSERIEALKLKASPLLPVALVAAGLALVMLAPKLQSGLARSWAARHAATLGLVTYPLYLVHQDAGAVIVGALLRAGVSFGPATMAAAALAGLFAWWVVRRGEPAFRTLVTAGHPGGRRVPSTVHSGGAFSRP